MITTFSLFSLLLFSNFSLASRINLQPKEEVNGEHASILKNEKSTDISLTDSESKSKNEYKSIYKEFVSDTVSSPLSNQSKLDHSMCKLEDFEFCEELGQGAFATVYRVFHTKTGKYYAAKKLTKKKSYFSHTTKAPIKQEIQALKVELELFSSLNSPFIVDFHCIMIYGDFLVQIFDLVQGVDAITFREEFGNKLTEEDIKIFTSELILGLDYLRSKRVSWNDVKFDNILIDQNGHLKLADFGLAERFKDSTSTSSLGFGTPFYMSPEKLAVFFELKKEHLLEPSDWYSLGVVIYALFTGNGPFDVSQKGMNDNKQKIVNKLNGNPPCLSPIKGRENENPSNSNCPKIIPPDASRMIRGLLNPNPKERMEFVNGISHDPWFINSINSSTSEISSTIDKQESRREWWDGIAKGKRTLSIAPFFSFSNKVCKNIHPTLTFPSIPIPNSASSKGIGNNSMKKEGNKYAIKLLEILKRRLNRKFGFENKEPIPSIQTESTLSSSISSLNKDKEIDFLNCDPFQFVDCSSNNNSNSMFGKTFRFVHRETGKLFNAQPLNNFNDFCINIENYEFGNKSIAIVQFNESLEKLVDDLTGLRNANILPFVPKLVCILPYENNLIQIFENFQRENSLGDIYNFEEKTLPNEIDTKSFILNLIVHLKYLRTNHISWRNMSKINIFIPKNYNHRLVLTGFESSKNFKENPRSDSILVIPYYTPPEVIKMASRKKMMESTRIKKITNHDQGNQEDSNKEEQGYELEPLDWYSLGVVIYQMIFPKNDLDEWISFDYFFNEEWNEIIKSLENPPFCLTCIKEGMDKKAKDEWEDFSVECKVKCLMGSPFSVESLLLSTDLIKGLMDSDPIKRMKFVDEKLETHSWWSQPFKHHTEEKGKEENVNDWLMETRKKIELAFENKNFNHLESNGNCRRDLKSPNADLIKLLNELEKSKNK